MPKVEKITHQICAWGGLGAAIAAPIAMLAGGVPGWLAYPLAVLSSLGCGVQAVSEPIKIKRGKKK